jgi:hypothetical protein
MASIAGRLERLPLSRFHRRVVTLISVPLEVVSR